jgi:hypothetical protein
LKELGERIKFDLSYVGSWTCPDEIWRPMAEAIECFVKLGCLPVMSDGTYAGNLGVRTAEGIVVSRSCRGKDKSQAGDFVLVTDFDRKNWKVSYQSISADVAPTSDTPLYWMSLVDLSARGIWPKSPGAAVHGHGWCSVAMARRFAAPMTAAPTQFSTRQDSEVMEKLFIDNVFPTHHFYIRNGHGFFAVEKNLSDLQEMIVNIAQQLRENPA